MKLDRNLLHYEGKALVVLAATVGFDPSKPPPSVALVGMGGPGEMMFYLRRQTKKWTQYESNGGRLIRILT